MSSELALMSRAGKTFYFSTLWLDREARREAALAYAFCRQVDDIADANPERDDRDMLLGDVLRALRCLDSANDLVRPIVPLIRRYPEVQEPLISLVTACQGDRLSLMIEDERDFERYAHGVAGNVGLIMYPILGGTNPTGRSYAADLGIAMQSTNIARDVREDLARGRVYLPATWLGGIDLRRANIEDDWVERSVVGAIQRALSFADHRYQRGLSGISFLSPRAQSAIRIAARCYEAIGERVIVRGRLARNRAVVPLYSKIILACSPATSERFRAPNSVAVKKA